MGHHSLSVKSVISFTWRLKKTRTQTQLGDGSIKFKEVLIIECTVTIFFCFLISKINWTELNWNQNRTPLSALRHTLLTGMFRRPFYEQSRRLILGREDGGAEHIRDECGTAGRIALKFRKAYGAFFAHFFPRKDWPSQARWQEKLAREIASGWPFTEIVFWAT